MNEDKKDMAAVGQALMQAISAHADEGWRPVDCPSEIVGDLRNQRDEALAEVSALKKDAAGYRKGVRDGLGMAASEMDDWACEMDSVSLEAASELREHAESLRGTFDSNFSQLDKDVEEDEIAEENVGHLSPEELAKDRELIAAMLEVQAEVKRLQELGWKQQDFAQALKNLLEEKGE